MKKSRLYTRTGDDGMTTTASGARIPKTSACIEAYGAIDELNACLGYLRSIIPDGGDKPVIERIQNDLFAIGHSLTSGARGGNAVGGEAVEFLEQQIDKEDAALPELHDFVIPGGTPGAAFAHVCRTVCRRAERAVLSLAAVQQVPCGTAEPVQQIPRETARYMNRLSDYLFVLSRKLNFVDNIIDNITEKSAGNTCR